MIEGDFRLKTDRRPLYSQVAELLRGLISSTFQPGDQLPSEPSLCDQLGVSRTTLRVALGFLEQEGAVVRRHGIGTFVSHTWRGNLRGGLQFLQSLESLANEAGLGIELFDKMVGTTAATVEEAEILQLQDGQTINWIESVWAVRGKPAASLRTLVPERVLSLDMLRETRGSVLVTLNNSPDTTPAFTQSQVFAVSAGDALAKTLQVKSDQALLLLVEAYYTREEAPVALSYNHFLTELFSFYIGRIVK